MNRGAKLRGCKEQLRALLLISELKVSKACQYDGAGKCGRGTGRFGKGYKKRPFGLHLLERTTGWDRL